MLQPILDHIEALRAHPMGTYILMTYAIGGLIAGLVFWYHWRDAVKMGEAHAKLQAAIANATPVRGKVSRFGAVPGSDEYSVDYTFTLEGDGTVYRTSSDYLSSASHGALTQPGDVVTFNVLPGYLHVRDFYNQATAERARR